MDKAMLKAEFEGKRITVMGLGLLGRGVGDAAFLASMGAKLTVTDLKSAEELAPSLKKLEKYSEIEYVLGKHRLEDFRDKDFILKAAGVPLDSTYIKEAKDHRIPVEMSASLFQKLAPVTTIGITGTRGKSTVTHLLAHILTTAGKRVHLGGNVRGVSTLSLLPKAKEGDYAVLELDSWQLQGFADSKLSPDVAIFTSFMEDHQNYYHSMRLYFEDKAAIYRYQPEEDIFIAGPSAAKVIRAYDPAHARRFTLASGKAIPKNWKLPLRGEHNRENAGIAAASARAMGIEEKYIKKGIEGFKGVDGRLETVRVKAGVTYINDTTATTPAALVAALKSFPARSVVLIAGGSDKELDLKATVSAIRTQVRSLHLLSGNGTERLKSLLGSISYTEHDSMKDAVRMAAKDAKKKNFVVLSPGFTSFGMFKNEYDRGDQFNKAVKALK
jgi:UDP-N-acetylmuramoylalanine--D-glutamate ligase